MRRSFESGNSGVETLQRKSKSGLKFHHTSNSTKNEAHRFSMMPRTYLIPPAVYAPTALSIVAIVASISVTSWYLAAIPFIWLGAICSAPNLNLANGCLSYLAMIFGYFTAMLFEPMGNAILFGSVCGFYLGAIEKHLRMRPAPDEDETQNSINGN